MRITFLISAVEEMSGGARVIDIYARKLAARGHHVTLVGPQQAPESLRSKVRRLLKGEPVMREKQQSHYDSSAYNLIALRDAPKAKDVPDADIVIATWWATAEWMFALPPEKGRKAHFVQHDERMFGAFADRIGAVLAGPSAKITISLWLDEMLRKEFGQSVVYRVPNSVDTDQFFAPPRGRQARPTVGMLYATPPFKGFQTGARAFELLRKSLPDAELVTFGAFAPVPEHPVPEGTRHTVRPPQDKIRDLYAQCDVWLCASLAEGFHLPPSEAMACRCVLVSTPVGGPVDIIEDGVNGYFVPFGDAEAMAERLKAIFAAPEAEWKRISDAGYETVLSYSWDDAADLFEQAVIEIAAA